MRLLTLLLAVLLLCSAASAAAGAPADTLPDLLYKNLEHKDPKVREAALTLLTANPVRDPAVIKMLVARYSDPQEHPAVLTAARGALKAVVGTDFKSPREARNWWEDHQSEFVQDQPLLTRLGEVERSLKNLEGDRVKLERKLLDDESTFKLIFFSNLVLDLLFVVVIIAFAVMGGSRLKAMRETIRQAERYVSAAEDVHKRFDSIVNDIEAKKTGILDYFRKLKEEHEAEIERYTELLEQNTEHRVREEAMGLRRKGEQELEETLKQLKAAVNEEIRRQVDEQKAAVAAQVQAQEKRFFLVVDTHTLTLEASQLAHLGRHEDAARLYRRALEIDPRHVTAWVRLAASLRSLGRHDEAIEACQKALAAAPGHAQALYGLAAASALQHNRDAMLGNLAKAFQADGELRDEALNDASFREYWQDAAFKDLAEA